MRACVGVGVCARLAGRPLVHWLDDLLVEEFKFKVLVRFIDQSVSICFKDLD